MFQSLICPFAISCLLFLANGASTQPITSNSPPSFNGKIKHVIAVMFENRSFDHMVGFLKQNNSKIDGCLPDMGLNCSNTLSSQSKDGPYYSVGPNAVYVQPGDPGHSLESTTEQLYGSGVSSTIDTYPAPMDGFIENYGKNEIKSMKNDSGEWIMECFTPQTVPIISTLASEFAIYDRWFADFPGCTEPNRVYSWLTTTAGMAKNDDARLAAGFREMSIFELLDKELIESQGYDIKDTWRLYFEQVPTPIFLDYIRTHPKKFNGIDAFFRDVQSGDLPLFSWLDPVYSDMPDYPARDQHPDHDVTEGEKFLKNIYESVRNGPKWNETLLMIFYDEHGGFFDHVSPPLAPNPDGINSTNPAFNFNRLGLRIPTIFVSPWIAKGTIGNRPESPNDSQYCHSSLVHTMREQFMPDAQAITKRDEWSLTFEDVINLDEMRQDCPTQLPNVPDGYSNMHPSLLNNKNSKNGKNQEMKDGRNGNTWWVPGQQPTSEFHRSLVVAASQMCNVDLDDIEPYLKNQEICGQFLMDCMNTYLKQSGVM